MKRTIATPTYVTRTSDPLEIVLDDGTIMTAVELSDGRVAERARRLLLDGLSDLPDVYQPSTLGRGKPVVR